MVGRSRLAPLLLLSLVSFACPTSGGRSQAGRGLGQTCSAHSDCSSRSCLATQFEAICTAPCQDNAGCDNGTVCGVLADGSRTCLPGCGVFLDLDFTCENGVPTACAAAGPASCSGCGCPSGMRCTAGIGCGPLAGLGETCDVDADCNTDNCSPIFHVCRTPVGQPCTIDNCDRCLSIASGWSWCSRECRYDTNCNGGHCVGDPDASYYTCQPHCFGSFDPDCPGGCAQILGTQTFSCTCATCSVAEPKRSLGQPCRRLSQCADGECQGPQTLDCASSEGCGTCSKPCADDAACGPGLSCAQVSCAAGQTAGCGNRCLRTCGPSQVCSIGTCRALVGATGSPVSVCDTRNGEGGACATGGDCQSGRCVVRTCVPATGAANGHSCSASADCQSASCVNGRCQGNSLIGDPCTSSSDCVVGTCCTTTCATSC